MRRIGSGKAFALLMIGMSILAFNLQRAESAESSATRWTKVYGGAKRDEAYSVINTNDGGYALAGFTASYGAGGYDFWLVKTNANGNYLWSRTFGGTGDEEVHSVVQTSDGGYALAGYTKSFGAGGSDFWLVRTDANGYALWKKTYGGTKDDVALSVVQTGDGGYALAGYTESFGAGGDDFWLVKTNANGNALWNKTYGGGGADGAFSVVQTGDGGYALAGYTESFGAGGDDFGLVKTDAMGSELWTRTYGGAYTDIACSVVQTGDGGYALAGYTESFGAGSADFWLVKTDENGVIPEFPSFSILLLLVAFMLLMAFTKKRLARKHLSSPCFD
jgi:predicted secreted protein with PEFG-CTERM motif